MSATTDLGKVGITVNGTWSDSVAYEKNSIVNDGADSYISIQDVPIGTALSNTAYWTLLCNGFSSAEVVSAVNAWLVAHPEATTTVQDGAVTTAKLADGAVTDAKLAQTGGVLENVTLMADSGKKLISKTVNWINAYVNSSGIVVASTLSRTAVVPLNTGETVNIGTANSNITIIGSTSASSVAVGDTVTPIEKTTNSGNFEEYSYTAISPINIVLCVKASNYTLSFVGDSYIQDELNNKVFAENSFVLNEKTLTATAGQAISASTSRIDVNVKNGDTLSIVLEDKNNAISDYYLYINGSSDYSAHLPNIEYRIKATSNITDIGFFADTPQVIGNGDVTLKGSIVYENENSIEAKADEAYVAVKQYVPHSIMDGYVFSEVVANGSFSSGSGPTSSVANRIRTDLIYFKKGDKFVIDGGTFQHAVGMWEGTVSLANVRRNDSSFSGDDETIEATYDGCIVIVFRKSDNSNISPSDFDGEIDFYSTLAWRVQANFGDEEPPAYYLADNYLKDKAARINELGKSGDDVFAFITDVHWERNAKHSPSLLSYLSKECAIHKLFDGGDVADGDMVDVYKKYRSSINGKSYHVTGNHDWFSPSDGKSLYYGMDSANNEQIGNPFMHYYYVDNVQLKIRYIVLNDFTREEGSTTITVGYDEDQIDWFSEVALDVPNDWDVIVFTHFLKTTSTVTGGTDIISAIDTFNADVTRTGKILGVFQGHTHWDGIYHTTGGVPVITTTCDKYDISNEPELSQEVRVLGTKSEQAFDIVILNRDEKKFYCVRIGALAQNNVDIYRTDENFEWVGTLEEREVSYANE